MSLWGQAWAWEQRVANPATKLVLVALASFADEEGYCYPSQSTLSHMAGQTERTVRRHLAWLERAGLIRRERRRREAGAEDARGGTWRSDGYRLQAPPEALRPDTRDALVTINHRTPVTAGGADHRTPVSAGGADHRTPVTAGGADHRTPVTAGGADHRTPVTAGGADHRTQVSAGGADHRTQVSAGGADHRTQVSAGGVVPVREELAANGRLCTSSDAASCPDERSATSGSVSKSEPAATPRTARHTRARASRPFSHTETSRDHDQENTRDLLTQPEPEGLGLRPEAVSLGAYPGDQQGSHTGTTPPRNAPAEGLLALQAGTRLREDAEQRRRACWAVFRGELGCEPATQSGKGAWRKAIADLVRAGATPEGVRQAIAAYRRRWPGLEVTPAAVAKHWHVLTGPGGGGPPAQGASSAQEGPRLAQLNWNGVPRPLPPAGDAPALPVAGHEGPRPSQEGPRLAQLNWNGVPRPLPPAGSQGGAP